MAYKYDPEKLKELQRYVEIGMTDENSAVLAFDIDRSTYYLWTSKGEGVTDKEKLDILKAIEKGKAVRNQSLILEIRMATEKGDGKLALDLLKRLENKTYGDSSKVKAENTNVNVEIEEDISKPPEERLQDILQRIKALKE